MSPHAALQLSGPHVCELLSPEDEAALRARLGDDPLHEDASPARAFEALQSTRVSIAQALLDQGRISGVGNILRAEGLFLARLPPLRPASELSAADFAALWDALRALLKDAARDGRIVSPARPPRRGPGRDGAARIASTCTAARGSPARSAMSPSPA